MNRDIDTPLNVYRGVVLPEWVDYNGHLNVAYYLVAFDLATDIFLDWIGLDEAHRQHHAGTTFTAEVHVAYKRELREGDPIRVTTQLLAFDQKRIRYLHRMYHIDHGFEAATAENLSLYVNLDQRRVGTMSDQVLSRLKAIMRRHARMGVPDEAGRGIGKPPLARG